MTPQEKANHLVSIHSLTVLSKIGHKLPMDEVKEIAKATSLLEVDELIKYHDQFMEIVRYELPSNIVASIPYKYWDEVKKELEI